LDLYSFLTYDTNSIITELLGARSDEHQAKQELYNQIIETGIMPDLPKESTKRVGGTKDVFNLYIKGMGLNITP